MKPEVIVRVQYPPSGLVLLEPDFVVHYAPTADAFEQALTEHGEAARALVTNGSIGVSAEQLGRLPNLEIVLAQGVGHENVAVAALRERGLVLATGKGTNAISVADHAMALVLGISRDIVQADRRVREGAWLQSRDPREQVWRRRLGILGLGEVGLQIAARAAGFEMPVLYHNRHKRADVDYIYRDSPLALASDSDFIVIVLPGGDATRGLVGREFLDLLGPRGYLINVGRGSIVDNAELASALRDGRIAGAALDVVAGEPVVPQELLDAPNLIITPHIAGWSHDSVTAATERVAGNLKAHFRGGEIISRVL